MSLNASAVMDGLGVRLATISGLRVFDFPPDSVNPPAAIVGYPTVQFDATMARGKDRLSIPVYVYVGRVSDRNARDQLAAYMAGAGASSVKAAVEAGKTLGGACDTCRVVDAAPVDGSDFAGSPFVAIRFTVDVVG